MMAASSWAFRHGKSNESLSLMKGEYSLFVGKGEKQKCSGRCMSHHYWSRVRGKMSGSESRKVNGIRLQVQDQICCLMVTLAIL